MIRTHQAQNIAEPVRHGFFTRRGGISTGVYTGLNVGLGSGDGLKLVEENRRRALAHLGGGDAHLCTAYQVHSARAAIIDAPWSGGNAPQVDAMVTDRPGIALGIVTADCVPVLLADAEAGVIGAAHAGWKGALSGVVSAALAAMESLGAARERIAAATGPAIAQASYEVGRELHGAFVEQDAAAARFFTPGRVGHFQFDLTGYVGSLLSGAGLESVWCAGLDTYEMGEDFYSYRRSRHRGEADYGRQLSAILLV